MPGPAVPARRPGADAGRGRAAAHAEPRPLAAARRSAETAAGGGAAGATASHCRTRSPAGRASEQRRRPAARRALEKGSRFVASECPLAASHIVAGMEQLAAMKNKDDLTQNLPPAGRAYHPIELFAMAYGLVR